MSVGVIQGIKNLIQNQFDFRKVDGRPERLVHYTGFMDDSVTPLRPMTVGSNPAHLDTLRGVVGPLMVEIGYGSSTVRVRFFRGNDLLNVWDLPSGDLDGAVARFEPPFEVALAKALTEDREAREAWRDAWLDQGNLNSR